MKKKNNKGFFLAETIVVVALITIVMAFVYPNVAKLYDNYSKRANYYDQIQDLFALKTIEETYYDAFCKNAKNVINAESKISVKPDALSINGLQELYLTKYIANVTDDDYDFNKYLTRLRKTTYDNKAYRLVGVFQKDGEKARYASIKIYLEGCK